MSLKHLSLTLLTVCLPLVGQGKSIVLSDAKNPESIAYDKTTDTLFVSSFGDGAIYTVNRSTSTVNLYQPAKFQGRTTAIGVKVDSTRHHLWVAEGTSLSVYDLTKNLADEGYTLAHFETKNFVRIDPPAESFLNDFAIGTDGSAYVSDSKFPRLYKVTFREPTSTTKTFDFAVFRDLTSDIPYGVIAGNPFNLNGLVLTPDEKALLAIKTNDGALYRIELNTPNINEVKVSFDLQNFDSNQLVAADGLAWGATNDLYVFHNSTNQITRLNYVQTTLPLLANHLNVPDLKTPTGGVVIGGDLFIANSQFSPATPPAPFDILQIPLFGL